MIISLVWLLISIGFAFYLYTLTKKPGNNQVLWTILGFVFTALAVSILAFKKGNKISGIIWLVVWIVVLESFVISASHVLSSILPNFNALL